jgi:two-component system sensor histidine kinase CpxA
MSLFLKIFLWFWAAMAVLGLSLFAVQLAAENKPVVQSPRSEVLYTLAVYATSAVTTFDEGGDAQLQLFLKKAERRTKARLYLFDPTGRQRGTSQSAAPSDVRILAAQASRELDLGIDLSPSSVSIAQPVLTPRGPYVFCATISRSLIGATRITRQTLLLWGISFFTITGLFCYGLARYLAAPVGKIRRATQRITAGDLSARVEPNRVPRGSDEITAMAGDFDKMAERLENLVAAQNRLLGDVSHELRTPLTRLNLALELARRGDDVKREAAFGRIERESQRLDELIRELLTLSRLENGLPSEKMAQLVDVAQVAGEVAADADFEAQNAGRGVRTQYIGPLEGVCVRGDRELLHRALENVARNALRHTVDDSRVHIEMVTEGVQVKIRVVDEGPGVPEADLSAIFRPFFRVEDARERSQAVRGTGLGLAIAERAVRAHGGEISAFNRKEGGLCVEIKLPSAS